MVALHPRRLLLGLLPLLVGGAPPSRQLQSSCAGSPHPLVWKATKGTWIGYLVGTYRVAVSEIQPVPEQVEQALACADIAYFELACSNATGDLGHYFEHCHQYPISDPKDTIAARLSPEELSNLTTAAQQLLAQTGSDCQVDSDVFQQAVDRLGSNTTRKTLQSLYRLALNALDTVGCSLSAPPGETPAQSYEDYLRESFGSKKPIFGLQDVSHQCLGYQSNTVEQDIAFAKTMAQNFADANWAANMRNQQEAMLHVMQCGDLSTVPQDPPWEDPHWLTFENSAILDGIRRSVQEYPDKTVLVAVGVEHLVNVSSASGGPEDGAAQGILAALAADGYTVDQVSGGSSIPCATSSYQAPGAKQQGRCLAPPQWTQPKTCTDFKEHWDATLGTDKMYGRRKNSTSCMPCMTSNTSCTCTIGWENTERFERLCSSTEAGDVHGNVMFMDLTRNPRSRRLGPGLAEKTGRAMFQQCYGASCGTELLAELALRTWYASDPDLNVGEIKLWDPNAPKSSEGLPSPLGGAWPAWAWVLAVIGVVLCAGSMVGCFLMPKRGRSEKARGKFSHMSEDSDELLGDEGDYSDASPHPFEAPAPQREPPRPPSPPQQPRQTMRDQEMQQQAMQQQAMQQQAMQQQSMQRAPEPPQPPRPPPSQMQSSYGQQGPPPTQMMQPQGYQTGQPSLLDRQSPQASGLNTSFDGGSLLAQAMQMQQGLAETGAQSLQHMNLTMQNMAHEGIISPPSPTRTGFGSSVQSQPGGQLPPTTMAMQPSSQLLSSGMYQMPVSQQLQGAPPLVSYPAYPQNPYANR